MLPPGVRLLTTLLSLAILVGAGYLLWSWYEGEILRDVSGVLYREREGWRLWAGLGLLAWSFLGRGLMLALLTKRDTRPTSPERGAGQMLTSPSGSSLYVETHGPAGAPTIIFTHGWGMDSTFWHQAKQDLGGRFRLVLWDLPGLGKSKPGGPQAVSLSAFATDLEALIAFAGPGRPVLVGHSIGGMTIQTLLRDRPEVAARLAGVVLLNTTYTNPLKTMILSGFLRAIQRPILEPGARLMMWFQPLMWLSNWQSYLSGSAHLAQRLGYGDFVTRSQLQHTTLLTTRNSPAVQAQGTLAMFRWDAEGALGRSGVPALVIGGDKDIVTKLEANRAIASQSGVDATLEVVPGVNHMGPMERADVYNRLIAEFVLAQQSRPGPQQPGGGT